MKKLNANLVIDLGNSETRVLVQSGKTKSGLIRQQLGTISNKFVTVEEGYEIPENYDEDNTIVFETPEGEFFANGLLVEREYESMSVRPTAIEQKQDSKVTMLTLQRAFFEGFRLLAKMNLSDIESLDVTWTVSILLPPNSVERGSKVLYKKIMGISEFNYILPEVTLNINVDRVRFFPEGFAAYIATLMRRGKVLNEDFTHLLQSKTLIVDIGAGTTDFFVVDGMETIESTKSTIKVGGNDVSSTIRQELIKQDIVLPESVVTKGVQEGFIKDGALKIPLGKNIVIASKNTANKLISEIISYLEGTSMSIRTIENLLVVGGGSLKSEVEGVEPLSHYIIERLKSFAPNIQLVGLPKEYKGEDPASKEINPRLLNILGAGILSEG